MAAGWLVKSGVHRSMTKEQLDAIAERIDLYASYENPLCDPAESNEFIRLARIGLALEAYQAKQKALGKTMILMNFEDA